MMTMDKNKGRPRGRPGVDGEPITIIVPSSDMAQIRAVIEKVGLGATLAGWIRAAVKEKLERDAQKGDN